MNESAKKELNDRMLTSASDMVDMLLTKRDGMSVGNRIDLVLQELVDLKVQTRILPITMRKLYAYKTAYIKKN